jgi:hypothetical protein
MVSLYQYSNWKWCKNTWKKNNFHYSLRNISCTVHCFSVIFEWVVGDPSRLLRDLLCINCTFFSSQQLYSTCSLSRWRIHARNYIMLCACYGNVVGRHLFYMMLKWIHIMSVYCYCDSVFLNMGPFCIVPVNMNYSQTVFRFTISP